MKVFGKTIMAAGVAAVLLTLCSSCEREGTERFRGNYSFKTSGSITVVRDAEYIYDTTYTVRDFAIDTVVTEHSDPIVISVSNEMGQMDVTVTDAASGRVAVSMNVTGGDMVVYYGEAEGRELTLEEASRHMVLSVAENSEEFGARPLVADVTVNGTAQRYENIILFDLTYEGDFRANGRLYHIVDSDIVCRAKMNE